jgi:hypothetical protein
MTDVVTNEISIEPGSNGLRDALLAGLGATKDVHGGHRRTSLNRTPPNCMRAPRALDEEDGLSVENAYLAYADGAPFPIPFFVFDMLRRAASVTDGNAFFAAYDSALARASSRETADLSLQYRCEAEGAAKTLDGLNIVADDLVVAAFLGKSAARLGAEGYGPSETDSMAALARLALRLLCDCNNASAARRRIDDFKAHLDAMLEGAGI